MVIQDLFLYFAKFPDKDGVKAMATMGASDMPEYQQLLDALDELPDTSLVPDIKHYVYGQTLEDLQQRVSRLFGSWLYADYGEFTMQNDQGSLEVTQRVAVTVAVKPQQTSDMLERIIASDRALELLSQVQAHLMADCDAGRLDWLARGNLQKMEVVPFVASELSSYGWTLLIDAAAPDTLDIAAAARRMRPPIQ